MTTQQKSPFGPILLTTFLDLLGITLIFPIMAPLLIDNQTGIFPAEFPEADRHLVYGFLLGAYPLAQFFGAPILGALSDRYGRKPILMLSVAGAMIGYILFGTAIVTNNLPLIFLSRIIPGFMGGNISVIYSAVSDLSRHEDRAKNFGIIGAAFGMGFILGPLLGSLLSNPKIVSWFNFDTPLWTTAILSFINLILIWRIFPETLKHKTHTPFGLSTGIHNIRLAFSMPNLRWVLLALFFVALGFSFFTQYYQVYLNQHFGFGKEEIGPFFGYVGIWIAFAQGFIVRRLSGKVKPEKVVTVALFTLGLAIPMLLLPAKENWIMLLFISPFIALSQGSQQPNMAAVVSIQATREQQGTIMGINQSMQSLGMALPSFIGGFLSSININYPLLAASAFILMGWGIFLLHRLAHRQREKAQLE